jgi:predicted AlkP superfamily pyrophosphatase or phosphodiesterase
MKRLCSSAAGFAAVLLPFWIAILPAHVSAKGVAEHVVVVVWDGMRPDFITSQYCPMLYSLAQDGVFFRNHHPVYVSSTEVNGTAIATGAHPDRSGVMANTDYRPEIGWLSPGGTESVDVIRRVDLLTGGHFIAVPTVAEILHDKGIATIIAGSKPIALLHDRSQNRPTGNAASNSVVLYKGQTMPRSVQAGLVKLNEDKHFPTNSVHPATAANAWTTKSLTHGLWRKGVPKYTLLWLSDPDASQHETGPGSDTSISAIEDCDRNLFEVYKALDEKKVADKTDIIVVSDHGFSTIRKNANVADILKKHRFRASRKFEDAETGDVMVVGLGGSVALYVINHDEETIQKLVRFLQGTDFAGVIFSRTEIEGTFPLDQVHLNTTNPVPDVVVSMRWTADLNDFGTPGMVIGENGTKGKGTHASLSPYDMHNTLVASGPDFRRGMVNELPTGNIDVAPTILWILGISPPVKMDGRVLHEALADSHPPTAKPVTKTIEARRDLGPHVWKQYLKYTTFGGSVYYDEGNGAPILRDR